MAGVFMTTRMYLTSAMIARWRSFLSSRGNSCIERRACSSMSSSLASRCSIWCRSTMSAQAPVDEADGGLRVGRLVEQPAEVLRQRDDHALAFLREVAREFVEGEACLLLDQLELREQLFGFHW